MRTTIPSLVITLASVLALDAAAQTLYKLVDKNGKVTYVDAPPKDYDGKVIRVDIDPNANKATLPKAPVRTDAERKAEAAKATTAENRVATARAKLESAQKALASAREKPGEGDVTFMANANARGTRPVLSDDYQRRLDTLEKAVKQAEDELRQAERG